MKGNEMLFQIIYFCGFVGVVSVLCYTGESVKIHRKRYDQENRKSREVSNMDKADEINMILHFFIYSLVLL